MVCEETEKHFQQLLMSTGGSLPHRRGVTDAISVAVLSNLDRSKVFTDLDNHMLEMAVNENHTFILIKVIAKCYCKVRAGCIT